MIDDPETQILQLLHSRCFHMRLVRGDLDGAIRSDAGGGFTLPAPT